jgi:hypothetical protein
VGLTIAAGVVGWNALGRNSAAIPALFGMVLVLVDMLILLALAALYSASS